MVIDTGFLTTKVMGDSPMNYKEKAALLREMREQSDRAKKNLLRFTSLDERDNLNDISLDFFVTHVLTHIERLEAQIAELNATPVRSMFCGNQ